MIRGGSRSRDSLICYARTMPGVRLIQHPQGEYARALLWGVSSSRRPRCSQTRPRKPNRGTEMTSPYLNRPLVPLAVALPLLLEQIEAELTGRKLEAAEERCLRRRAESIGGLRAPSPITCCSPNRRFAAFRRVIFSTLTSCNVTGTARAEADQRHPRRVAKILGVRSLPRGQALYRTGF